MKRVLAVFGILLLMLGCVNGILLKINCGEKRK